MKRIRSGLRRGMFLLGLITLWELAARFGPWPDYLFPPPSAVLSRFGQLLGDGRLPAAVLRSLGRLAQGYLLAMVVGIPLGMLTARLEWMRSAVKPFITGLQALPSVCWLPVSLLWFGLSDAAIIFVVVMGSLLAIAIATEDAVAHIEPLLLNQARMLGLTGPRLYASVLFPAALPGIITGLKLGWSFAWRALLGAELLFVSGGLGLLLHVGRELLDVAHMAAVMIAITLVGVAVDRLLFQPVELKVRQRWGLAPVS